ncbi:MAG: hypothetical protein KDK37_04270, partial [Leptospiraceae bacterium]|nr:hypothetical protein [Leptospiraceae bacterium]
MKKQNSRKDFLLNAAGFLTAATLSQYCSTVSKTRYSGSESVEPLASAHDLGLTDPILIVLNAGISAPNPHNTQAWKFKVHSSMSAVLYVDEDRVLPATDPTYRQIHIGQGCFLELASIAAGALHMELNITLLPEGYSLPRDLGRKPIAKLELKPATEQRSDPLAAMIGKRHTVRSAYDGPLITESELTQLA